MISFVVLLYVMIGEQVEIFVCLMIGMYVETRIRCCVFSTIVYASSTSSSLLLLTI